jgi:glycosyltransferase involved in cell wall biosynthesis
MKLSVLMPAFNEGGTVAQAIKRVLDVDYPCDMELVVVDDGSADDTADVLAGMSDTRLTMLRHTVNLGKGAAVRTAADAATGDWMLIFDADLEYTANDILRVLEPVLAGDTEVVLGTRTFGGSSAHSFWFVMGNRLTTFTANLLFNSWINDLHACLKLLPLPLFRELDTNEDRFGMDTELVAKLLLRGIRPIEVSINYRARTFEEGKKISWRDGLASLKILLMIRLGGRRKRFRRRARIASA